MIVLPVPAFVVTFLLLSLAAWLGATRLEKLRAEVAKIKDEFGVIQAATLTLLGLIVGFTFSMALDRYEQRKDFESAEANAIATAYLRADLLPATDAARLRSLLVSYLDLRVRYYEARIPRTIREVNALTTTLQAQLWDAVKAPANANPNSVTALAVAAVNDVLSSQGDTQAAWVNRIPFTAWMMMGSIAFLATMLVGVGVERPRHFPRMLAILPLIISFAFFLIADVESPRLGIISVVPDNLLELARSLNAP
jgi:hypothetical protein